MNVSWYDAVNYANWLSAQRELEPFYILPESNKGGSDVKTKKSAQGYRLPTEVEWEFAAEGGNKSEEFDYSGSSEVTDVAWFKGNSDGSSHRVKERKPNELGLYDMSGNLWEWCEDWSKEHPPNTYRVRRGGSWREKAENCKVSHKGFSAPENTNDAIGFRLVCPSR